jgi:hypothetical protein
MLPKTPYVANDRFAPVHEPINDLPVHPATNAQLFIPTSESRHFTRTDAGHAFDNTLLPADARIPHPELIAFERRAQQGLPLPARQAALKEELAREDEERARRKARWEENLARKTTVVEAREGKMEWHIVDINVSKLTVGATGRKQGAVGWRYGFPHEDRKRGAVKIPTRVE